MNWKCKLFGHKIEVLYRFTPEPDRELTYYTEAEQAMICGEHPYAVYQCKRCHVIKTYVNNMSRIPFVSKNKLMDSEDD